MIKTSNSLIGEAAALESPTNIVQFKLIVRIQQIIKNQVAKHPVFQ